MQRALLLLLVLINFSACVQKATQAPQRLEAPEPPKRLLFLVFDQLRPDLIDRYGLKTFQKLREEGLSFPNAHVGHLSSLTVVSHTVMSTGLLPKNLPWQADVFKDAKGFHSAVDLKQEIFFKHLAPLKATSLPSLLKSSVPAGRPVFAIAQKAYAAQVFGGPGADSIITLGPKRAQNPFKGWRAPEGLNVPEFFVNPVGGRYYVEATQNFGSENTPYPLDGNRFMPTSDSTHIGGDAWVATAALEYMKQNKNWRAGFLSFGAIDKMLHMLGEHEKDTTEPWALNSGATLKKTLERADGCLSALLQYLSEEGILNETLIVITADHGGQASTNFHGIKEAGRSYYEFGKGSNFSSEKVPDSFKPLMQTGLVEVATFDSMLRFWLKKNDPVSVSKFAKTLKSLPGVAEVYVKQKTGKSIHYIRHFRSPDLIGEALEWAKEKNLELVETMATAGSPEVVGLLLDQHGYSLPGEHGGAQRQVQSIPLILVSPLQNQRARVLDFPVRLVDLSPLILRIMDIPVPAGLDGSNHVLNGL